ncbi:MAG: hypothetical protein A2017_08705 [Lentisphaerae bacterium GWF2_44_16]|nr:MAG: hypothetical protein A2017_08705 [Lentisphaerae bacterium GWF2_44_16]
MADKKEIRKGKEKQESTPIPETPPLTPAAEPLTPKNDFIPPKKSSSGRGKIKISSGPKEVEKKEPEVCENPVDIEKEASLKYGKIIGSYEILKPLSISGTAELYLVQQRVTCKKYLLHLLPALLPEIDPDFSLRFTNECSKLKRLSHRNIIRIHASGTDRGYYYLVVDYIENSGAKALSLADRLERVGRIPEFQVKKMAQIICNALDYAHNCAGGCIAHSDLKPSNILYDKNNLIWICGFSNINMVGKQYFINIIKHVLNENFRSIPPAPRKTEETVLAEKFTNHNKPDKTTSIVLLKINRKLKFMNLDIMLEYFKDFIGEINPFRKKRRLYGSSEEKNLLSFKSIIETYDYMSPEQKAGEDPSPQSNVYSMGLILYHMLTGKRVIGNWDFPSKYGCGKGWDPIILKCLQMEPEHRYQSISELYEDIRAVDERKNFFYPIFITALSFVLLTAVFLIFSSIKYDFSGDAGKNSSNLILKKSLPYSNVKFQPKPLKIPFRINVQPPGASMTFFKNGEITAKADANEAGAVEILLEPGTYMIELAKENYENSRHEVTINAENNNTKFTLYPLQSQKANKQYVYKTDLKSPQDGFPWLIPGLNMELLPVTPGSFLIGSPLNDPERDSSEIAFQSVNLEYQFWMARLEVNQNEYEEIMWHNPSLYSRLGGKAPVERTNWYNAMEFCKKLTAREKTAGRLPENYVYRLPTEVEWEYCCRAGSNSIYPFGSNKEYLPEHAWTEKNSGKSTHPSGEKKPNSWGFYDMLGNVGEWCLDVFGESVHPPIIKMEEEKPAGSFYIIRGGSWGDGPEKVRCASRVKTDYPLLQRATIGFRIVLAPLNIPDIKKQD